MIGTGSHDVINHRDAKAIQVTPRICGSADFAVHISIKKPSDETPMIGKRSETTKKWGRGSFLKRPPSPGPIPRREPEHSCR